MYANDVVTKRRDPGPRLNSRMMTISDGYAGIFRWMMGFALLFFLDAGGMAVSTRQRDDYCGGPGHPSDVDQPRTSWSVWHQPE